MGIDFTRAFFAVSCEGIEESFIIIIRGEDVLLVDASGYNVINSGTAFDAGNSGHKQLPFNQDYIIIS
jgi:uncharacterized cupin superfamily protein